jgi:hypothetical protein
MTMLESHPTIGNSILTNGNDEELAELFIAAANALRRALGQSALCVGALASPRLPSVIRAETSSSSS